MSGVGVKVVAISTSSNILAAEVDAHVDVA
jgi:hypothetical protein